MRSLPRFAVCIALICVGAPAALAQTSSVPVGTPASRAKPADEVVAVVDGTAITYAEIRYDPSQPSISELNGKVLRKAMPATEVLYRESRTLRRRITQIISDEVERRLNISVSDDELRSYAAEANRKYNPKSMLDMFRAQADTTEACLDGLQAVYERGMEPDQAYATYVKGKADIRSWQMYLASGAAKSQRDFMARQIKAGRSATLESLSSPGAYAPQAKEAKLSIAVVAQLAATNPEVKAYYDSIKWPLDLADIIQHEPSTLGPLIHSWWTDQYKAAHIAIKDHDYNDVLIELGIAPVPKAVTLAAGTKPIRLELRHFCNVVSNRYPNARYSYSTMAVNSVEKRYVFHDRATNTDFPDGAKIDSEVAALHAFSPSTARTARLSKLQIQKRAFDTLIAGSPLIISDADLEPNASAATQDFGGTFVLGVMVTLTPTGTKTFADFTSDHVNEIVGIVANDRVLSMPNVETQITDGQLQISGGFHDTAEAQLIAARINLGVHAATGAKK